MPNGVSADAPEEYQELYRARNYIFVSMKYTFTNEILHRVAGMLVSVFEIIFKKLSDLDSEDNDKNIQEIKVKYPNLFDKYFDTYYFLKALSEIEVDKISLNKDNKYYEYELDGKKIHLTYENLVEYFHNVESFYKLAKDQFDQHKSS